MVTAEAGDLYNPIGAKMTDLNRITIERDDHKIILEDNGASIDRLVESFGDALRGLGFVGVELSVDETPLEKEK